MIFIWIAILAYFLFAVNGVVDKFLLSRTVKHPAAYAFYIGITGPLTWLLVPFGLEFLSPSNLFIAIVGGACFIFALYFLYAAIQQTSISRILPLEGGLVPIFTLLLSYTLLGEHLTSSQLQAFAFLVAGGVLVMLEKDSKGWHASALFGGTLAAFLFALSLVLTKYTFDLSNFVSGLVWTRLGFLIVSLGMLIPRASRRYILQTPRRASKGNIILYYGSRLSGGLAGLLQNYAISIGSVTIVNALQGTQHAILLLLTLFLSKYFPKILKEKATKLILLQKSAAIALIAAGLILLTAK